jgi:hypothetical protein
LFVFSGLLTRLQVGLATWRGCLVARLGRVDGAWCVALEAGALVARGVDLPTVRRTARPWATGLAGALFAWPRDGAIRLVIGLEGGVTLVRPALELDDDRLLWRAPPASVRTIVGLEISVTKRRRRGHQTMGKPAGSHPPPS